MKKVGVLGSGTMGSGIAQVIAKAGYEVIIRDIREKSLEKGMNRIIKSLDKQVVREKISEEEKRKILNNLKTTSDLNELADCDLIIEAIVEKMDIKTEVFSKLDNICKEETILASNTSGLSITEIASSTNRSDKVLGVHFFNPAEIMKLVELIKANDTSEETFKKVSEFVDTLNKEYIKVEEAPGFVVNRILLTMINEAIFVLSEKTASAEDIDKSMKLGANHPIGPLALADMIGLDICLNIIDNFYDEFQDSKYRACPLLRKKVRAGHLGRKTGQGFYKYD